MSTSDPDLDNLDIYDDTEPENQLGAPTDDDMEEENPSGDEVGEAGAGLEGDGEGEDDDDPELENEEQSMLEDTMEMIAGDDEGEDAEADAEATTKPKAKKAKSELVREPGKSLLPFSRVQKILKADKELPMMARDAVFLISIAAEEFIKRFCEEGVLVAQKEKRSTVNHRDLATVVRRADEFFFMEDVLPWTAPDAAPKRPKPKAGASKPKGKDAAGSGKKQAMLDHFGVGKKTVEDNAENDIVMNEDGTIPYLDIPGPTKPMRMTNANPASSTLAQAMKIVSTFHPSSSVITSVKCRLAARDLEHLVVGKLNRVDVYSARSYGLEHECGVDIWGKVCAVKALPLSTHDARSHILVMITHPCPELLILAYREENDKAGLVLQKSIPLLERSTKIAELFTDVLVHPSGKFAIASCYAGRLKVITFKGGRYQDEFDVMMRESTVLSITLLPTEEDKYTIGILYLDAHLKLQLCARDLDPSTFELTTRHSFLFQSTPLSETTFPSPPDICPCLIPIPGQQRDADDQDENAFLGGVLVVGGREIVLFEMASEDKRDKHEGKHRRLESKMKSKDPSAVKKAKEKEKEREIRRRKPKVSVQWPYGRVAAWTPVSSRFLIGDAFGRLALLSLDNLDTLGMVLVPLGEISQPTTLTYLTNQALYVGSHTGDSQLVQISPSLVSSDESPNLAVPSDVPTVTAEKISARPTGRKGKEKAAALEDMDVDDEDGETSAESALSSGKVVAPQGSFLTVLESYKNIAPIMDAILVDTEGSGQNEIVTCSGGANTGSVNVVRNGADFKELASISGLLGVTRCWGVKSMIGDEHHSHFLVSTLTETHVFRLDATNPGIIHRLEDDHLNPFKVDQPTLAFANVFRRRDATYVKSSLVVQVVSTGVRLLEYEVSSGRFTERHFYKIDGLPTNERTKTREVVVASANSSQVVLALSGGNIVFLRVENNRNKLEAQVYASNLRQEISAVSLAPLNPVKEFTAQFPVAYWENNVIEIFKVAGTKLESTWRSVSLPSLVRSVLLYNFGTDPSPKAEDYHGYLLAGLADGSVASMTFKAGSGLNELKIFSLGHCPVHLTPCTAQQEGKEVRAVFAAANRSTVFFVEKKRLMNSPIMLKEIGAASSLNTATFGQAVIVAATNGLFIGRIGNLNKMHIRTVPFGYDNPQRIAHDPGLKVYAVACKHEGPSRVGQYEQAKGSLQLIDDSSLTIMGRYQCPSSEEINAVATLAVSTNGKEHRLFCVGTFTYDPTELEPTRGRLLIFTTFMDSTSKLSLELSMLASEEVNGCVFAIKAVKNKIVAAVNSSILLYEVEVSEEKGVTATCTMKKLAAWNHNYLVTSLGSFEDRIVAGDIMSSVSLLKVDGNKFISEARDYGPTYPSSVEALSATDLICANDSLNLIQYSLTNNLRGRVLERRGFYHIAEIVSKFVRGSIAAEHKSDTSVFTPEVLYFTGSGKIGVIVNIKDEDLGLSLSNLERNVTFVVKGFGGESHSKFRAPKGIYGPSDADKLSQGFLDGDLLEKFIPLAESPETLRVMLGDKDIYKLDLSQEEILKILEQLQSLH